MVEPYPSCDQCTSGHCRTCDGFRTSLHHMEHPCGCYIADPASHPNTADGKQAAKTAHCRENRTHYPQSLGFGDYRCSACGWIGKREEAKGRG